MHCLFDSFKLIYYLISQYLVSTRCIFPSLTHVQMHMRSLWDPRDGVTQNKYISEHLLWVIQFSYVPIYLGLSAF